MGIHRARLPVERKSTLSLVRIPAETCAVYGLITHRFRAQEDPVMAAPKVRRSRRGLEWPASVSLWRGLRPLTAPPALAAVNSVPSPSTLAQMHVGDVGRAPIHATRQLGLVLHHVITGGGLVRFDLDLHLRLPRPGCVGSELDRRWGVSRSPAGIRLRGPRPPLFQTRSVESPTS